MTQRKAQPKFTMSAEQYQGRITESEWERTIIEMASYYGWVTLLNLPDVGLSALGNIISKIKKGEIRSAPLKGLLLLLGAVSGWPDLTLGHPKKHRLIFVELKVAGRKIRPNQHAMIHLLIECGQDVYVWDPKDADEAIKVLSGS